MPLIGQHKQYLAKITLLEVESIKCRKNIRQIKNADGD